MPDMRCAVCGGPEIKEKRDFEFNARDGYYHVVKDVPTFVCLGECGECSFGPEEAEMISRAIKQSYSPQ